MEERKDKEKNYNLYTEHIMPEKSKKIKRLLKKAAFVVVMAVVFGLVAGLVMIIVYRTGSRYFGPQNKQEITLDNSYTTPPSATETTGECETGETVTVSPEETEPQETETESSYDDVTSAGIVGLTNYTDTLKSIAGDINKSSVVITVVKQAGTWTEETGTNCGIIVSNDTDGYYIITENSVVDGAEEMSVKFADEVIADAVRVASDSVSNIAVIRASRSISSDIPAIKLGNSDSVVQGDPVVAVGNLYGLGSSFDAGIVTGINGVIYDIDSRYNVINTDINFAETGYGFICNIDGEIIAIAFDSDGGMLSGYAISSIRTLIENLINGRQKPYFGIKGQNVTSTMKEKLGIPEGVYISAVEVSSPAYAAGIQTGDVITAIEDEPVDGMEQIAEKLSDMSADSTITVTVKRKSKDSYKEIVFRVVLGVE